MKRILLPKVSDSKEINLDNASVQKGIVAIDDSGALPVGFVINYDIDTFNIVYYNGDRSMFRFQNLESLMIHYGPKGYKFYQL